ncbi:hypothetical protein NSU_2489 [Novosphingobium pentaromativorans US6-1]|uniref:DUF465 domain-containing protein n=1 Tax=Novosphingobium pentaromativorans US6-1 TaxID=1088721 RepID=G6EDR8_9SPHN|nr:hypothetical protein NSU_2489 [Novosphingobium pentaromativorans US6-1]
MTERIFRLLERQQRLDVLLRLAQGRQFADPHEIALLKRMKTRIRDRLSRHLPPIAERMSL